MSNKQKRKLIFVLALVGALIIGFIVRIVLRVDLVDELSKQIESYDMGNLAWQFVVVKGTVNDNGNVTSFTYRPEGQVFTLNDIRKAVEASTEAELNVEKVIFSRFDYRTTILWNAGWVALVAVMTYFFKNLITYISFSKRT